MRKLTLSIGARVLVAAVITAITTFAQGASGPANPSPQVLAPSGIIIQPMTQHEPVGLAVAQGRARTAFPKLPTTIPMTGELVMFHNTHVFALQKAQPAWLVTWRETSSPPLRAGAGATVPAYKHMNALISATTGQTLEIFPSP